MCNLFFENISFKNFPAFPYRNYCRREMAVSINCYECTSVFLPLLSGMQIASFLRRITLSSVACLAVPCTLPLSHKRHGFQKNVIEHTKTVLFSLKLLSETSF
jgi:hypothetical protein